MDYTYVILIIIGVFFLFIEVPVLLAAFSMAPWVPTRKTDLERVDELAKLKPGEVFYDLGCGDGRVCHYIAEKNPEAKVVGFELAYPLYIWAQLKQFIRPKKNLEIKLRNVFKQDLSGADVVYLFGLRKTLNGRLKGKFENELKEGSRVLIYDDEVEGWDLILKHQPVASDVPIYIYNR